MGTAERQPRPLQTIALIVGKAGRMQTQTSSHQIEHNPGRSRTHQIPIERQFWLFWTPGLFLESEAQDAARRTTPTRTRWLQGETAEGQQGHQRREWKRRTDAGSDCIRRLCHGAGDRQRIAPTIYTPHPEVQATAVQTLNQIAAVVKKKPEKYDLEVHALLQGAALAEGLTTTDQLAVADREALDAARLGRSQNHVRWRDFLSAAVTRWQEYAADFQRQEAEFTQAIENARACISNARERFETCKAALSEDELKEVAGVTTDDPMGEGARASIGQLDSRRAEHNGCQPDDPEVLCGRYVIE